ncbi:hypothetical protein GNZ12_41290 [Paraburkholderia sp. 1N]|uniref:Uncharacterized protein n=1 Tax=Paraburkholderia solitsugae TaxID=2675748 RepID=A0ABX2C3P1_9BURK|nr:hypothetical protein [Paraburkholderia solitsugae]NPT47619.1 hypothetical protein [Paraburkholderia solitsugae]
MSTAVQTGSPQEPCADASPAFIAFSPFSILAPWIWAFVIYGMKRYDELEAYPVKR